MLASYLAPGRYWAQDLDSCTQRLPLAVPQPSQPLAKKGIGQGQPHPRKAPPPEHPSQGPGVQSLGPQDSSTLTLSQARAEDPLQQAGLWNGRGGKESGTKAGGHTVPNKELSTEDPSLPPSPHIQALTCPWQQCLHG